ncbi:putative hydroxypyruvate isomerase isoform X1 [Salvelinus sp. IW2-2015]|uniref:putative hydroxypyruvate isomerase isoform X1 n=1 Tax=Salvelinus sp. IW2-2015 TaxID=2691554 RepID=UPI000CEB0743|nr:putative hydroxypyruvate isomerase isoform X1 [Salvelinus alpinus]
MPPLKFCANLSWLFTDLPEFTQRIYAAASAGFQAVEAAWLYDSDLQELQSVKNATGVDVVLINTPLGDAKAGDLGLGAVPGREEDFRKGLDLAMQYAKALDCRRIHLMAGRVPVGADRATIAVEMEDTFVQNLKHAADVLSNEGITGLIEPINTRITDPRYFLDSPHQGNASDAFPWQAAAILQKVGHPNIKLQMDVFHWQIMDSNLTQNIHKYFPLIGHIQIAQVPSRNEPDSAGELNFPYLFSLLEELGYQGYIGCEYKPLGSTNEGLGWVKDYLKRNKREDHACKQLPVPAFP